MPSLVRGSLSGLGSWKKKPWLLPKVRTPVTMPGTSLTCLPASGERRVVPWMSWMRAGTPVGGGVVPPPVVSPLLLVGAGAPAVKSLELSSVSPAVRDTAAVLLGAGALAPSTTTAPPKPTRSCTRASAAQSAAVRQVSGSLPLTRATVPAVADMLMLPVASAVGSAVVPPVLLASPTRYFAPAAMLPVRAVVCQVLVGFGAAGRYCTLQPSTDTAAVDRLASST